MAHWIEKNETIFKKYQLGYTEGVKCGDSVEVGGKMRCQGKGTRWLCGDENTPPRVECMTCDSSVVLWHLMDADRS